MPNTRGPHGPPILQDAASHLWRVLALRKLLPRLLQPQVKRQLQWFRGSDPLQLRNVSKLINTWDILAAHSAYSQNDVVQVLQIQYQDPPVDRCSFNQTTGGVVSSKSSPAQIRCDSCDASGSCGLQDVQQVFGGFQDFVAICKDGRLVTWGKQDIFSLPWP